jgi:hypothetical protein
MLGWIILFALIAVFGTVATAAQLPAPPVAYVAVSLIFAALFVIGLLAHTFRRRI